MQSVYLSPLRLVSISFYMKIARSAVIVCKLINASESSPIHSLNEMRRSRSLEVIELRNRRKTGGKERDESSVSSGHMWWFIRADIWLSSDSIHRGKTGDKEM